MSEWSSVFPSESTMVILPRFDKDRDHWWNWHWREASQPSKFQQFKHKRKSQKGSECLLGAQDQPNPFMVTLSLIARCHWLFEEEVFLWVFFSYPDCVFSVRSDQLELQFLLFHAEERTSCEIRDVSSKWTPEQLCCQYGVQHICSTCCKGGEILVAVQHSGRVMAWSEEICLCHL